MSPTSYQTAPPRINIVTHPTPSVNFRRTLILYNKDVLRFILPAVLALTAALSAQTPPTALSPLKDIRAGMRGTGRPVFTGNRIDDFNVEILGILENFGPKESHIPARLSGGPL